MNASILKLSITVANDDIKVVKSQLQEFVDEAGSFQMIIKATDGKRTMSPELVRVVSQLFGDFIVCLCESKVEGIN
jgi:hypothetical protein